MAFEQTSVGARPRGQVGQLSSINLQYDEDQLIAAGLSAQSVAITVASAVNGATYQLTESNLGEVATYVADGSATTTEIAAGLAAAWNANPMLASLGLASAVLAVCTIPMRSTNDGQDVAVITSTGDTPANLTIVNTAASLGSVVPYGVLIYQDADGNATTTRPASGTIPNVLLGLSFYQSTPSARRSLRRWAPSPATSFASCERVVSWSQTATTPRTTILSTSVSRGTARPTNCSTQPQAAENSNQSNSCAGSVPTRLRSPSVDNRPHDEVNSYV